MDTPCTAKPAYTVAEVAVLLGVSRQTVTRLFLRERGVLVFGRQESARQRGYLNLRIPHVVYQRVRARLEVR